MVHGSRRSAFTLIEMLVVIGIIAVLAAILFPVFSSARIKARQTACIGHLHQVVVALKQYAEDYRAYPPAPSYDGTRFWGGVSSLWPDYISDQGVLICPDDLKAKTRYQVAKDKIYSSYNADIDLANESTWLQGGTVPDGLLANRTYNYYGFDDNGYDVYDDMTYVRPTQANPNPPWWLEQDPRMRLGWRHYPRLMNRYAPDNTIVVHCVHHRQHYSNANKRDIVMRLGGEGKVINLSEMAAKITGPGGATVTAWVHQR
jgi:prepilin-type N-terminal cleavage/methylation domain-containing protein